MFLSRSRLLLLLPLFLFLLALLLFGARLLLAWSLPAPDPRFGVVESYEAPAEAAILGTGWTRVRFHWGHVQAAGPESWVAPISDRELAAERNADRLVVGLLIGIPDWARKPDQPPDGLWLPDDDPGNLWATYVREAVTRYQGEINHWIIWNEPDIWQKSAPGHTWDGTVEDFAQLQRVAYRVAREANPDVVIHLAAFTYFWDANYDREQYFSRLLDLFAADPEAAAHNYYFDVATAHLYFQPDTLYDVLIAFQEIMADHGLAKPIWLVETNAPPVDDPAWPVAEHTLDVDLNEQAAFMPQALVSALAAGAERVAVYKLQDRTSDVGANPEPFGLVRLDGSRRPAFTTYRVATHYLSGAHSVTRERWDGIGWFHAVHDDYTTDVLFSRLPLALQEVRVPARAPQALLVDMWGNRQMVEAQGDSFTIQLPNAVCSQSIGDFCMIGSTVFYLIQADQLEQLPGPLPRVWLAGAAPAARYLGPAGLLLLLVAGSLLALRPLKG